MIARTSFVGPVKPCAHLWINLWADCVRRDTAIPPFTRGFATVRAGTVPLIRSDFPLHGLSLRFPAVQEGRL